MASAEIRRCSEVRSGGRKWFAANALFPCKNSKVSVRSSRPTSVQVPSCKYGLVANRNKPNGDIRTVDPDFGRVIPTGMRGVEINHINRRTVIGNCSGSGEPNDDISGSLTKAMGED